MIALTPEGRAAFDEAKSIADRVDKRSFFQCSPLEGLSIC